ncbi:MAG TPA: phage baseplate assembly protein V [Pseudacidobacterium sp.]|nr:phage baseplate assembly protein V [Pseudacidobacterium sp.]
MPNAGYIHVQIGEEDIDLALLAEVTVLQKLNAHWTAQVIFRSLHDAQPDVAQMLGQTLKVSGYDLLGVEHTLFSGPVRDVELVYEVNGSYGARVDAISASWLMDQSQRHAYFLKQSPSAIAQTLAGKYGLALKGPLEGDAGLSRVQWSESDWGFLLRLVDDGEAWLRPTENGLETQTSFQPGPTLPWREGEYGLMEFSGAAKMRPVLQSGAHYDHRAAQSQTYSGIKSEAAHYDPWSGLRGKTLAAGEALPAATVPGRHRATTLDSYQQQLQKESRRQAVNATLCSGISRSPEVLAGNEVTLSGVDQDVDGTYGVIECLHHWTPRGYESHFKATTAKRWFAPERPARPQAEGVFPARVTANHDPQNLGRVQVQFYWQEENATTWARLITGHAGAGRGLLITPEIGDEVAVRFEEADPERPYILGSVWNGVHLAPTQGLRGDEAPNNDIKRLVTKSGHRLQISDRAGVETIALSTPTSNRLVMTEKANETGRPAVVLHTDGDIILAAPKGRIHLQSMLQSREVGSTDGSDTTLKPGTSTGGQSGDTPRGRLQLPLPSHKPKTCKDAPETIHIPKHINRQMNDLWHQSFPGGNAQEHGGIIVKDSKGVYQMINIGSGQSGSFMPNRNIPSGMTEVGLFHTHPYSQAEGGYTGVSFSGADIQIAATLNEPSYVQSGNRQFLIMPTEETPTNLNYQQMNNAQNARIAELMEQGKTFQEAARIAANETAKTYKMAYYQGSNGVLHRVSC